MPIAASLTRAIGRASRDTRRSVRRFHSSKGVDDEAARRPPRRAPSGGDPDRHRRHPGADRRAARGSRGARARRRELLARLSETLRRWSAASPAAAPIEARAPGRRRRDRLRRQPRPRAAAAGRRASRASTPRSKGASSDAAEFLAATRRRAELGRGRPAARGQGADPGAALARRRGRARRRGARPRDRRRGRAGRARAPLGPQGAGAAAGRRRRQGRRGRRAARRRRVRRGRLRRRRPHRPRRLPPPARAARGRASWSGRVCVGVRSPEAPPEIAEEADLRRRPGRAGSRSSRRWRPRPCPTPTCCESPSSSPPARRPRSARSPRSRSAANPIRRPSSSPPPGG